MKCGFIGLGSQGAPMALRMINAGLPVSLWARRDATLDPYRGTPATLAPGIAELGAAAQHVGLCVVDDAGVRDVCTQLIPAMRPGSVLAIHSTIHPDTCREIARTAGARGIGVLDAPVSGGAQAAEAGTLTVMVGGDPDTLALARPVFETFGRLIVHLGGVGAGQHAKLINNTLLAANLGMADAALTAGDTLGIGRPALLALLAASSGRSYALEVRGRMADPRGFAHGGALLAKDMGLLGEVLGQDDAAFRGLSGAGGPFLALALAHASPA